MENKYEFNLKVSTKQWTKTSDETGDEPQWIKNINGNDNSIKHDQTSKKKKTQ